MKKQLAILSILAAVSMPAAANFYVLGGAGQSKYSADSENETDTALTLGAGYKFNKIVAVEVNYNDFGELSESYRDNFDSDEYYEEQSTFGASALQATINISIPIQSFSIYGRLGIADIDFEASYEETYVIDGEVVEQYSGSGTISKTKTVVGLGGGYAFNDSMSLRAEYTLYDKWEELEVSSLTVAFVYEF